MDARGSVSPTTIHASGTEPRIKIISIGSTGVGKSCIVKRYCEGRFVSKYIPTIGIDYGVKRVQLRAASKTSSSTSKISVRVNFWDMAGGEEYLEIRNEFYYSAEGVLLVYDVTDAASFAALEKWVEELEKYMHVRRTSGIDTSLGREQTRPVVVVCANKVDDNVESGRRRIVSNAEGRKWAEDRGYKYFETSACSGTHVAEALETLFNDVVGAFM